MAKVLANKDESKCLKPLIAVNRPVRDRNIYDQVFINEADDDDWEEKGHFSLFFFTKVEGKERRRWGLGELIVNSREMF